MFEPLSDAAKASATPAGRKRPAGIWLNPSYVSGPFSTLRAAQRAATAAIATHTCLDAQVWDSDQVEAQLAKGAYTTGEEMADLMRTAKRLMAVSAAQVV